MGTTTSYVPYDYRRTCDLCGNLYNISKMFKKGPYTYCLDHAGERISEELDRGNARQRPFRVLPVPNAKPEDQTQPDVFESEESVIFALLDAAVAGSARYLSVDSGSATALPNIADVIPTNAWACIHYYGLALATYPKGHTNVWQAQTLARMRTSADILLARQTVSGSVASNSFYGGFLGTGASLYYSEDASTAGLALLYAYRLLGDLKYLYAARAAASFLRNLQAIGSCGVHFTSSDAAGNARLYTGAITNTVAITAGFYADHLFYPSCLLALRFWNELKLTDGDQAIGATAAIAGDFTLVPSQLMSACMADLRDFWETGTYDTIVLANVNGFTTTTPREFFNAYPVSKPNTTFGGGTGSWEFYDGPVLAGTTITSLNFAKAVSSLYAVDGASAQVNALDDWLRSFTSNTDYETAANTSARDLARATTGVYVASQGLAQLLLVREPTTLAAIAKNGGSLYDWGAFGLMSSVWSARNAYGFKLGRIMAAQERRRLSDGLPSDGFWDDRGFLRGRQGLTQQTGFREVLAHGPGANPALAEPATAPPLDHMIFWFKSDVGVTVDGSNRVTNWADQGPNGYDLGLVGPPLTFLPTYTPVSAINRLPAVTFSNLGATGQYLEHRFPLTDTHFKPTPDGSPVMCLALLRSNFANMGLVCTLQLDLDDLEMGCRQSFGSDIYLAASLDHNGLLTQNVQTNRTGQILVMDWIYYGPPNYPGAAHVNGIAQSLTPVNGNEPLVAYESIPGFSIGNMVAGSNGFLNADLVEVMLYGGTDPGTLTDARNYLYNRAGQYTSALTYDALAAAQFGLALRYAPRA